MPMPPKLDPARGHRGRGPVLLPATGRPGAPPRWPLSGRQTAAEKEIWTQLWATPQSTVWERLGAGTIRIVARYARLLLLAEDGAGATVQLATVALEDRLGLSPKSMRLMLWEIGTDEVAAKREERQTARGRIKAVNPA